MASRLKWTDRIRQHERALTKHGRLRSSPLNGRSASARRCPTNRNPEPRATTRSKFIMSKTIVPKKKRVYMSELTSGPHEVEVGRIKAFGIEIDSRYNIAGELIEMLEFARMAESYDVAEFIKGVSYDSK